VDDRRGIVMAYGTVKRGKVKFKIGSAQDKFLHTKKLPHTHVHMRHGEKVYVRFFSRRMK